MDIPEDSIERGKELRTTLGGSPSPRSPGNAAGLDLVPELEDYVLGINFGTIWSRPELDPKTRCGLVLSMLTAQGGKEPQIRAYVGYALNAGWTKEEITEIFVQAIPYLGLPSAFNGLRAASEVFKERGLLDDPPPLRG